MALSSINPATGQLLATFETLTPADVAAALDRAATAFRSWRETPSVCVAGSHGWLRSLAAAGLTAMIIVLVRGGQLT